MDFRHVATTKVSFERHVFGKKRRGKVKYGGNDGVSFQMPRTQYTCTESYGTLNLQICGLQHPRVCAFWDELMHRFCEANNVELVRGIPPSRIKVDEECCVFDATNEPADAPLTPGCQYDASCIVRLSDTWMSFDNLDAPASWGLSLVATQIKIHSQCTRPKSQFFVDGKLLFLDD